ncbi:glycosyltransferase [Streptomyces olivoreticuli]|uniref:glycosyltransferase n=1 Tax=Streptomyces olivoreticuli TaxID=68246 RepID=UPI00265B65DF|nr:glycosyltransferase [Streptomyces olivoreticuli]WKK23911.1 glycosyltransferase [Streptomyces olivoreticuli]
MNAAGPVSVIVAVRDKNGMRALPELFATLAVQDYRGDVEVIVVDHHPRPTIQPTALRTWRLPTRVIHEPRAGLSQARNTGISAATGHWVLITDPHARPTPGWVRAMVAALTHSGAGLAGGQVVPQFTAARAPVVPPAVLRLFAPTRWPEAACELAPPWWVAGCNLGMRRSAGLRFDTRFGHQLSCAELEMTVRAQWAGEFAIVAPDAVVRRAVHPYDLTLRAVGARAWWHGVSVARLMHIHPYADIGDTYRLRDTVLPYQLLTRTGLLSASVDVIRYLGLQAERWRVRPRACGPSRERSGGREHPRPGASHLRAQGALRHATRGGGGASGDRSR